MDQYAPDVFERWQRFEEFRHGDGPGFVNRDPSRIIADPIQVADQIARRLSRAKMENRAS